MIRTFALLALVLPLPAFAQQTADLPVSEPGLWADTDQFLLGEEIMVAPVLEKGATRRIVVFPPGLWRGDDGQPVAGPASQTIQARLTRLPWWRRIRD
jgi:alpha-glucosidase (family GH31 glycosyl hydrolase)